MQARRRGRPPGGIVLGLTLVLGTGALADVAPGWAAPARPEPTAAADGAGTSEFASSAVRVPARRAPLVAGAPGRVRRLAATPADGGAVATWRRPASHGSPLRRYRIELRRYDVSSGTWRTARRVTRPVPARERRGWIQLENLVNGTRYAISVRAVNGRSPGPWRTAAFTPRPLGIVGEVRRLTLGDAGRGTTRADDVLGPVLSPDRTRVAFTVSRSGLVAADTNSTCDVYVSDLRTGELTLASATPTGAAGNGCSTGPVWSPDGTRVAFTSSAADLTSDPTGAVPEAFVRTLATAATVRVVDGVPGSVRDRVHVAGFALGGDALLVQRDVVSVHRTEDRRSVVDLVAGTSRVLPDEVDLHLPSPDGRSLLAQTGTDDSPRVAVHDLASGTLTDLGAGTPAGGFLPHAWSPDGRKVAVRDSRDALRVHDLDAGTAQQITSRRTAEEVAWTADSRGITYIVAIPRSPRARYSPSTRTEVRDLATGQVRVVCSGRGASVGILCYPLGWSPGGTRMSVFPVNSTPLPGAWDYVGPVVRDLPSRRFLLPASTQDGHAVGVGRLQPIEQHGLWADDHHLLVLTSEPLDAGDLPGTADLYLKEIP